MEENIDIENTEVKVKFKEKKKFDYSLIFKWIFGVYFVGFLMSVIYHSIEKITNFTHDKILTEAFMSSEVSKVVEFMREPLILLILIIPFFIPMTITLIVLNFAIVKLKVFPQVHKKAFMTFATTMLFVVTLSMFLFN